MNTGDTLEDAFAFVGETGVTLPVLLDKDKAIYSSYPPNETEDNYAPYPLQVLLDQDGVVRYLARQYDAEAVRAAIDGLLAE